jgi:RNA polymerase sigma-70 factor (ECF subfamily)
MSGHHAGLSRDPVDERGELAARIAAGDRTAFERLHARLHPGLLRLFMRRSGGRSELADELAQQTWGHVWQTILQSRYDPARAAISTFVYAIANNVWLQHFRASRRTTVELPDHPAGAGHADAMLLHAELLGALRDCLHSDGPGALTDDERLIVLEQARGGTERELAAVLKLAASTVHARKLSGLEKLRRCLEAKGFSAETVEQLGSLLE